jgi:hypothetical protein
VSGIKKERKKEEKFSFATVWPDGGQAGGGNTNDYDTVRQEEKKEI